MSNPTFRKGIGRLTTDRYDFESHIEGSDFRHKASAIDLDAPITIGNTTDTNIDSSLNTIASFINGISLTGQGFITVGDGYDTYHAANGTVNFDTTVPSLDTLLNPIFTSIVNYQSDIQSSAPVTRAVTFGYERIKDGGVIVIKSGTYIVKNSISVPPGITLIGEGFGTKIINATALNTTVVPVIPAGSPVPKPMFIILQDTGRAGIGGTDSAIDPILFVFNRATRFANMIISDNFVEPTCLGDTNYKQAQNNSGNTPLIKQNPGSNLSLNNVYLDGRFQSNTIISTFAVQADNTLFPTTPGTILKINDCFIDGFSVPVDFRVKNGLNDFLEVSNSKIRAYGHLDDDNTGLLGKNSFILINDCNLNVTSNHFYGKTKDVLAAVYFEASFGAVTNYQATSKMIISNNNAIIDKGDNTTNNSFEFIEFGSIANFTTLVRLSVYGNNFDNKTSFRFLNTGNAFVLQSARLDSFVKAYFHQDVELDENISIAGNFTTQGSVTYNAVGGFHYAGFTITIQSPPGDSEYLVLIDTSNNNGVTTINLPAASLNLGRKLIIKDIGGLAAANNIVIVPNGTDVIEGLNVNKTIFSNYGGCTLLGVPTNFAGDIGWVLL